MTTKTAIEQATLQAILVDGDPELIKVSQEVLTECGYATTVLPDPLSLNHVMESKFSKVKPAIVMIDVSLPRISGYELVRRFLAQYGMHKIMVLMTTKHESPEDRFEARNVGALALLGKPLTAAAMKATLEKIRLAQLKEEIGKGVIEKAAR